MNVFTLLRTASMHFFKPSTKAARVKVWLLVLLLLVLPLGQLPQQVISLWLGELLPSLARFTQIRVYPHDVIVSMWMLLLLLDVKRGVVWKRAQTMWNSYRIELLAVTWLIGSIALAVLSSSSILPLLYLIRLISYGVFIWTVYVSVKSGSPLLALVLISLSYLVFLAGAQYFLVPDIRFLAALGWDDHYYRAAGTLFDPNFLGSLTILLLLGLWSVRSEIPKTVVRSTAVAALIVLALTYSRASFLAFFVAGGYLAWKSRARVRLAILPTLIGLCMIGGLFWLSSSIIGGEGTNLLRTTSISARIENTFVPLTHFSVQDWIVGQGMFTHSHSESVWIPDNLVILILSGMGIVGFVLWMCVAVRAFVRWRHHTTLIAIWISVIVHAQFNNTLLEPFHILYLGLLTSGLLLHEKANRPRK